ncbi:MAG TPA: extracellular solute-binding protein, partial [Jiangellaceae bacterium]|nr:extracellular solute-binding protein [Jiangellaceae bacterium]
MRTNTRGAALAALCASVLLTTAACGGGGSAEGGGENTITWWHNSNNQPGKGYYEQVAKDFEADHPGIDVQVSAMAHEDMVDKLGAAFQSGDVPDVYMERGGGELADHVEAGLVRDLSEDAADEISKIGGSVAGWQVDGKTYSLPYSMGVVGFWYNKELFAEAGVDAAPTTMDELYSVIDELKGAGLTPLSVGAGDKWPAGHYWYYTALRSCPQEVLEDAVTSLDFSDPCFVQAGEVVDDLLEKEPFNAGFLSTPAQEGATSASGLLATEKVAMEMQGHWEPGVMQGLTDDGKGLGEKTAWFPFPAVEGGQGDPAAQLGGGDAWAVAESAPDEAVELVKYMLSDKVQKGFAENDMGLPTNPAAGSSVKDPALAELLKVRDAAPYVQLYFDTAFGANVGGAMNDAIALMFA